MSDFCGCITALRRNKTRKMTRKRETTGNTSQGLIRMILSPMPIALVLISRQVSRTPVSSTDSHQMSSGRTSTS
ncbi:hypothetical protein PHMEG_00036779, partial [Phytophthora megakarya]